jgi:hypothetical protein
MLKSRKGGGFVLPKQKQQREMSLVKMMLGDELNGRCGSDH